MVVFYADVFGEPAAVGALRVSGELLDDAAKVFVEFRR